MRHYRFVTRGNRTLVFDASGGLVRDMPVFAGGAPDNGGGDGGGSDGGAGGGEGGDGSGEGGTGTGDGGDAGGDGGGEGGGEPSALETQALEAIEQLKKSGAEIPDALNNVVKEFRRARDDAAKERNKGKSAADEARKQIVADLAKALGITTDEDDNDPEKLKGAIGEKDKTIAQKEAELADLRKEKLVSKYARKEGADEDLTYAYLTSRSDFKQLDPSADGVEEQVSKMVQAAIEEKKNLKVRQAPPSSGPDLGGGGSTDDKPKSLEDAVTRKLAKT